MAEIDPVTEFKEGLALLRNNYAHKAMPYFTRALQQEKANPFYLSYLGVAMAAAERKWDDAEELCAQALKMRRTQPELYLNLADVYRLAGKRQEQIKTLFEGLHMTKRDPRIAETLRRYGFRRPPVIPFLDRNSLLNRELGKLRFRVLKSLGR